MVTVVVACVVLLSCFWPVAKLSLLMTRVLPGVCYYVARWLLRCCQPVAFLYWLLGG